MKLTTEPANCSNFTLSSRTLFSNEFYLTVMNAMDVALLVVNAAGMTVFGNKAARRNLSAYPGIHLNDVIPDLWSKIAHKLKGGTLTTEVSVRGGETNYVGRISPIILDQQEEGAVCFFVANSGLEAMAMQMRIFQELTQESDAIINSSSVALWICDGEGNILRMNPASERLNQIEAVDYIGRNMKELVDIGFVDKSATLEVIRTGKMVNLLQQRQGRTLILTGTPVFDKRGHLIRVVVSERDVNEIDHLQRELEEQEAMKDQFRNHMLEMQQLKLESRRIIAKSPNMVKALQQALKVSTSESSVLLLGESGVGKGLFADLIHKYSRRSENPLIKLNCGAIPESLIESELFGYEKGAFTGAQSGGKPGYFELADGGILFLDEVAELPLASQVKLLRFLEDGRITRLGGTKGCTMNVRILAATHRNLEEMVELGKFRLDLYYRLKVIPIYVPSVRERKACILPLIHHYVGLFSEKNGIKKRLTRAATDALLAYSYPGNVRELMNVCERLVVMTETEVIDFQDLPGDILGQAHKAGVTPTDWPEGMSLQQILDSVEKQVLSKAMERCGNQYRIAEALGLSQPTVNRRLKKYDIQC
ncbi:MAG: sigma 54-interacting transcriptional regulator [Desulfuromonadaceae bacterium]|nr:sigma 54-interacting transcriptional regulator [Desulfuromonadaceae bacterium]